MTEQTALDARKGKARLPATIDAVTSMPIPTQRSNLKTLDGVRNEMARTYRGMKAGELDGADGSRRAYVLSLLAKIIEAAELTRRIEALEQRISGR